MEKLKKVLRELMENKSEGYDKYDRDRRFKHRYDEDKYKKNRGKYSEEEDENDENEENKEEHEHFGRSKKHFGKSKGKFKNFEREDDEEYLEMLDDLEDKVCKYISELEEEEPELFKLMKFKLHELVNGPHFTKELCEEALECVSKEYKRREAEFELEEAKQIAKKFGVELKDFNEHDWHYALNVCHCIFEDICRDDMQMCARLSYLWLNDKAIPEGKAFHHYMKHLKHKEED